jgi:hypothetical protein
MSPTTHILSVTSWHGVTDIDRRTLACQKALLGVV